MPRILFVSGFHPATRARDLAFEFERYGPLVRCDVPAPRNPNAIHNPYAFVEFRSTRDAEDAYYEMHGRYFEGSRLSIQWAKNPPSSVWRYDRRSPPHRSGRDRERSRSPRRRDDRDRDDRDRRRRSRSPVRDRRRSPSPIRRKDDRDHDRARTPPLPGDDKKDIDERDLKGRVQTPPYDH
ncbi:hypothetical protein M413DRAFT_18752 [Hebeloma cylindrosporum]|uniref:RRM domain-containing protein n=1 Tax=Hebeloma cylindrosporum TaxID=76867 RepID=A0A0C3BZ02_HEBCY|nr:hypothetical protein M413DRAFT_18752 [Hebeloma cylindrosporum h7]